MRRLLLLLACVAFSARAVYPEKPIRFIIPSAPGGSPDVLMRILTHQLSQQMSVPTLPTGVSNALNPRSPGVK